MEKEMECQHSRGFDIGFRHKAIDRARGIRRIPRVKGNRHMDEKGQQTIPVAMRLGDTPVLIPNTMVKT